MFDDRLKKILHIAPEPQLSRLIQSVKRIDYLSADLSSPLAMVKMDITEIHYSDNVFDVILCSHVLEHVPDDRKALSELYRVLKHGGWAILQVPIGEGDTFEDPTVSIPLERERLFGQSDHVRNYGKDYEDRLRQAGFLVTVDQFVRKLSGNQVKYFGLLRDEDVYFCVKPKAQLDDPSC